MGDDEFSLRTSSPRIVSKAAPKNHKRRSPTFTAALDQFKGLSNVEIARQLLREELAMHKQKPPRTPTAFSRKTVRKLPWKRKGFLKDHRKPWEPPKIALKRPSSATRPRVPYHKVVVLSTGRRWHKYRG